jgi:predicted MFS family arabinose efflux permease
MDRNFRRNARKLGLEVVKNIQLDDEDFRIERARLEISLAFVYLSSAAIVPYGWVMGLPHPPLPAALVVLFVVGFCTSGLFQPLAALVIDLNPQSPAAATAAFNLVRCLLGAGGEAFGNPMVTKLGRGWTSTIIAALWLSLSTCWWAVVIWGPKWRRERRATSSP